MKTLFLSLLLAIGLAWAPSAAAHKPTDTFALDPEIVHGRLDNGLEYYIYRCLRPAYKANFYLVENIGCTVEEPGQLGMAHFIEHMAFAGTERFPGNSLVEKLEEQAGLRFGYDINAYTSLDHTEYRICDVNTLVNPSMVDTCLLMLKEISCGLRLDADAVERERSVILEEWRQGNDALARVHSELTRKLFGEGHPYARQPIGAPGDIAAFTPQSLREFYDKWYQPQHQAVVVVGYVNPEEVKQKIEELWGGVVPKGEPSTRQWAEVDAGGGPHSVVVTDPELTGSQIDLTFALQLPTRDHRDTYGYFEYGLRSVTAYFLLSARLGDIIYGKDSPWSIAEVDYSQFYNADSMDMFRIYALYDFNNRDQAITRLVEEVKRAVVHGVTDSEVEMARQQIRGLVDALPVEHAEQNNYENYEDISDYVFRRNIVTSFDDDMATTSAFADTVSAASINAYLRENLRPDNMFAVLVENSANPGVPDAESLKRLVMDAWENTEVAPVEENDLWSRPLIPGELKPGKVVDYENDTLYDARHYRLANGARVAVCRRSVLADKIELRAVQRGGESVLLDSGFVDGSFVAEITDLGGLGEFSNMDLMRRTMGCTAELSMRNTAYAEIIEGESRVSELETLLQMLHLRLTTARRDEDAFENMRKTLRAQLADRGKDPADALADSIYSAMYGLDHPYIRRINSADIDTLSLDHILALYRWRTQNPAAFDFIILGNVEYEDVEPLIEKYIGSLPGDGYAERAPFHRVDRLAKEEHKTLRFAVPSTSPVTSVYRNYEIHRPYTLKDEMALRVLASIYEKMCLQSLRLESGGTYSPSVGFDSGEVDGYHSLRLSFDTNAEMAEQLMADAEGLLRKIAADGPDPELFKSTLSYEKNQEYIMTLQQGYPLQHFTHLALYGDNDYYDRVQTLRKLAADDIQAMAAAMVAAPSQFTIIMDQTAE